MTTLENHITIGDEQYELVLSTRATKEIAALYGGLENLGDKLMKSENFEMAIGEIVWLGAGDGAPVRRTDTYTMAYHAPCQPEHPYP